MHSYLKYTAFTGILLVLAGFMFAPALQSIGAALIFLHPFISGDAQKIIPAFKENKILWLLPVYYLLTFLSIFYTDNYDAFWKQNILLKLPFLLFPIGLSTGAHLDKKKLNILLYFFVGLIWLVSTASFINYLVHFDEINAQIKHSKPIPVFTGTKTVVSHIYFGIMLAFATCITYYFSWMQKPENKVVRWLLRGVFFTFLIYMHSIVARTGMLAFYASVFIIIIWLMWRARKFLLGLSILSGIGLLLAASLFFVPSLNNRLANTKKDISQYTEGKEINHYSISMRIESYKTAWKVYKNAPLFGVGPADIVTEMHAQYEAGNSPLTEENRKLPHNQFLQTLTTMGIPGFAVLLGFFVFPFYYRKQYLFKDSSQLLFIAFLVICFFSFQVESIVERQLGVTFFSLFYILLSSVNTRINEN
ncbi:MAG: O-antigen ligase family protein [Bacteroidia bacterium]